MGKELVLNFSGNIPEIPRLEAAIDKLVRALGGKRFYIEGNKIVVVL